MDPSTALFISSKNTSNNTFSGGAMEIDSNSPMSLIPVEIIRLIFSFVPKEERETLWRVNRQWRQIAEEEAIWDLPHTTLWKKAIGDFQTEEWQATKETLRAVCSDERKLTRVVQTDAFYRFSGNYLHRQNSFHETGRVFQFKDLQQPSFETLVLEGDYEFKGFYEETKMGFWSDSTPTLRTYDIKTKKWEISLDLKAEACSFFDICGSLLFTCKTENAKKKLIAWDLKTCKRKGEIECPFDTYDGCTWNENHIIFKSNSTPQTQAKMHIFDLKKLSNLGEICPLFEGKHAVSTIHKIQSSESILCAYTTTQVAYQNVNSIHFWLLDSPITERMQSQERYIYNFCMIKDLFITFHDYREKTKSLKNTKSYLSIYDIKEISKEKDFSSVALGTLTLNGKVTQMEIFPDRNTPKISVYNEVKLPSSEHGKLSPVLEVYTVATGKRKKKQETESTKKILRQ